MAELKVNDPKEAIEYFEDKIKFTLGPVEVNENLRAEKDFVLVDVRAKEDFDKAHVPGAISLPQESWGTYAGLSKEKVNILYCYSHVCHLAANAALQFARTGFPVMEMDGGFAEWQSNKLPVECGASAA